MKAVWGGYNNMVDSLVGLLNKLFPVKGTAADQRLGGRCRKWAVELYEEVLSAIEAALAKGPEAFRKKDAPVGMLEI